ncbi:MAG: cyclic peptide export ABC transporter [bacterium]|nr:cyclic peptide export ABC transporter [bacterium]
MKKDVYTAIRIGILTVLICLFFTPVAVEAQDGADPENIVNISSKDMETIDALVKEVMETGHIPGVTLVLIKGKDQVLVKNFGYADLESKTPVTPGTIFELGSNSKSFTALAILKLEQEGLVKLDDPVSKYFPWFKVTFRDQEYPITIRHLLTHTSGLSRRTFGSIPEGDAGDALESVVRGISGTELDRRPGGLYDLSRYSNTNFDIAGAIIEVASGMKFEEYMAKNIFAPLGMPDTSIGPRLSSDSTATKSTGYKISFSEPGKFESPVYRGNFPAGYVVTNGNDMARWLQVQLGLVETGFKPVIEKSQTPDNMMFYWMGWFAPVFNSNIFWHGGLNPNFTSFVGFDPKEKFAVAVLANSNSSGTTYLARQVLRVVSGMVVEGEEPAEYVYQAGLDGTFSTASKILGFLLFVCIAIIIYILIDTIRGVRHFKRLNWKRLAQIVSALVGTVPILVGIYLVPGALNGFTWDLGLAWAPGSFPVAIGLLVAFLGLCNVIFIFSQLLPYKDLESLRHKYLKPLPMILVLGFISGLSGAAAIFLISATFFNVIPLDYLMYYFAMVLFISVAGSKIVRTKMTVIANNIVYEMRMKLITKIFATRFQQFEKIDSGRVYATLNNDTETIANSAGMVVGTITNAVTAVAAFVYLSAISLWATLFTLVYALSLGGFYIVVGKKARVLMEQMRDTQNVFMKLIEGLVQGFREISMHHNKKVLYDADVEASCDEYRRTRVASIIKFINANLFSNSMFLILLAGICFSFPKLFPEISMARLISFIMVLLYMINPITAIMRSFPTFIRIKVSWDRIQKFITEIPSIEELNNYKEIDSLSHKGESVNCIEAKGVMFAYPGKEGSRDFSVGPIDLKVNKGEILFIVGGNGSGKTTLAKLLTGLYQPESGTVTIDGKEVAGNDYLGEYFSVIFDDFRLFEKLYDIDTEAKKDEIDRYLKLLEMDEKVELKDGKFSTIDLSSGQKKRLALMQCYLEDCPIYLFDEVAADQDPQFRKFFYRDLLMKMRDEGKIIIAITHDDHYFDVADQIIKMDMGTIDNYVIPAILGKGKAELPKTTSAD